GLAARGATVIADDLVVIDRGRIFAGPRTIDLRAEPVPALRGDLTVSRARGRSRWRLALPPAAPSYPFGGWVFLHGAAEPAHGAVVVTQPGLTVTPVPAADRLRRLARARGLPSLASDPRDLLELAALPSWDVVRPLRWDMLEPTVDALLDLHS
ncbi:MAG: hypothetical protein JHD16_15525, partial [Solirubrobacteraceae bacterium]|nr:hypothetical protein [Solirubrobacteraceae bacterium]